MLDLAGFAVSAAAEMDGTSFLPLLSQADEAAEPGRSFLIEYFPIPHQGEDVQVTTKGMDGWCTDPDVQRSVCPDLPVTVDSVNNTWACVRTFAPPARDTIFCHFYDATGYTESFVRNESNFAEYCESAVPCPVRSIFPQKLAGWWQTTWRRSRGSCATWCTRSRRPRWRRWSSSCTG